MEPGGAHHHIPFSARPIPSCVWSTTPHCGTRSSAVRKPPVSGPGHWASGTRPWTTALFCRCTFCRRPGWTAPSYASACPDFLRWITYRLGQCIAQAVDALGRRAVFVASGDLSHKLKDDGPYGFAPEGPEFDRQITEAMAAGDFLRFLIMDPALCEQAAECGMRSFQIMAGALDGQAVELRFFSYEGVTGVGYGVAAFTVTGPDAARRFGKQCEAMERVRLTEKKAAEDP